jgi:16S rRNA (guanine527-N7)-methyltransferase
LSASALEAPLRAGLAALSLELLPQQVQGLLDYAALIAKWTQVYNLTALRDPASILSHHILDSLAVLPSLQAHIQASGCDAVLDVGSGAGLPGVVIALCCPDVRVDCVDTVGKKAAFIQQAALALKLPRLRGVHARVEQLTGQYPLVTSRAFASLPDFVAASREQLAPGGVWMAMKGQMPDAEMADLPADVEVFHVEPLQVPRLDAQRCLVWMRKKTA